MNSLIRIFALATAVSGGLYACSNSPATESASADTQSWHSSRAMHARAGDIIDSMGRVCSDGQIAAIVAALNQGEIVESQAVRDRLVNADVRDFAQMLIADHSQALQKGQAILSQLGIVPVENDNSKELQMGAQLFVQAAASLEGTALDRTFVAHQVLGHLKALAVIDGLLLTSAKEPQIRALLTEGRTMVAMHLHQVTILQARLAGSCGGGEATADAGSGAEDTGVPCDDAGPSTPAEDASQPSTPADDGSHGDKPWHY